MRLLPRAVSGETAGVSAEHGIGASGQEEFPAGTATPRELAEARRVADGDEGLHLPLLGVDAHKPGDRWVRVDDAIGVPAVVIEGGVAKFCGPLASGVVGGGEVVEGDAFGVPLAGGVLAEQVDGHGGLRSVDDTDTVDDSRCVVKHYDAVDLFAGPGGWEVGAQRLGLSVIGIEWDRDACATREAAGLATIRADVATYPPDEFVGINGLIASPPCPSFSMAGKRDGILDIPRILAHVRSCGDGWIDCGAEGWRDDRSRLVLEVVRWASALRPRWIACEQVPPVLPVWEEIGRLLTGWGYSTWCGLLSAETFGVPQTRERAILMARRDGKPATPPAPTHQEYQPKVPRWTEPRTDLLGNVVRPWISMADALDFGMTERPFLTLAPGTAKGGNDYVGGSGARAAIARERTGGGFDGSRVGYRRRRGSGMTERHGDRRVHPIDEPAPSLTGKARTDGWTLHTNRDQREDGERQTCDPAERPAPSFTAKSGGQWSLRQSNRSKATQRPAPAPAPALLFGHALNECAWVETRPATTVQCDPRVAPPGHHDGDTPNSQHGEGTVKITVEESAVLQSFPADYPWQGTRTSRFQQIGNAFCPLVAQAILRELAS